MKTLNAQIDSTFSGDVCEKLIAPIASFKNWVSSTWINPDEPSMVDPEVVLLVTVSHGVQFNWRALVHLVVATIQAPIKEPSS